MLTTLNQKVSADHCALLVVDMQNFYCHPEGYLAKRGRDMTATEQLVPKLMDLVNGAKKVGVPVIYLRQTRDPYTVSEVTIEQRSRLFPDASEDPLVEGDWQSEFYSVLPESGDIIITKHRYSAFIDTSLELILRSNGIKSIIVAGVATNVCIESTARDGFMKDYYVVIPRDCTAASSQEVHESSLGNIAGYFGEIVVSGEIIACWQRQDTI
ncbi:cysteine hydrolase family protein [Chloroflexota bacterium]